MSRPPGFVSSPRPQMSLPSPSSRAGPPPFDERTSRSSLATPVRSGMSSHEARESRQRAELPPRPRVPSPETRGSRSSYGRTSATRSSLVHSPLLSMSGRYAHDGHERRSTHSSGSTYVASRSEHAVRHEREYEHDRQHRWYAGTGRADAYEAYVADVAHEPRRNSDGSIAYAPGPIDAGRPPVLTRSMASAEADRAASVQRGRVSASTSLKHERLEYGAGESSEARGAARSPSPSFDHQHKRRRTRPSSSERSPRRQSPTARRESPCTARSSSRRSGAEREEPRQREPRSSTAAPRSPIKAEFGLPTHQSTPSLHPERFQAAASLPSVTPAQGKPTAHHARLLEAFEDLEHRISTATHSSASGRSSFASGSHERVDEPETSTVKAGMAPVQGLASPFEGTPSARSKQQLSSSAQAPPGASSINDNMSTQAHVVASASHHDQNAPAAPEPPSFSELLLRAQESTSIDERIQNARILLKAVRPDLAEEDREATRDVVWDLSESEYRSVSCSAATGHQQLADHCLSGTQGRNRADVHTLRGRAESPRFQLRCSVPAAQPSG
jgi:hypothetical protein